MTHIHCHFWSQNELYGKKKKSPFYSHFKVHTEFWDRQGIVVASFPEIIRRKSNHSPDDQSNQLSFRSPIAYKSKLMSAVKSLDQSELIQGRRLIFSLAWSGNFFTYSDLPFQFGTTSRRLRLSDTRLDLLIFLRFPWRDGSIPHHSTNTQSLAFYLVSKSYLACIQCRQAKLTIFMI